MWHKPRPTVLNPPSSISLSRPKVPLSPQNARHSRQQHSRPQQPHRTALAAERYLRAPAIERLYRRRRPEESSGKATGARAPAPLAPPFLSSSTSGGKRISSRLPSAVHTKRPACCLRPPCFRLVFTSPSWSQPAPSSFLPLSRCSTPSSCHCRRPRPACGHRQIPRS